MKKAGLQTVIGLLLLTVIAGSVFSGCKSNQDRLKVLRNTPIPLQPKEIPEIKVELIGAY